MGFGQYLKDTKAEMNHVSWPTRQQAIMYTIVVIIISIVVAAYIGVFDWLFTKGVNSIVPASETPAENANVQVESNPNTFEITGSSTPIILDTNASMDAQAN